MRAYIVGRGESLWSVASRLGFNPEEVWNAPENRELRERRASSQVLAPGDVLYVPDVEQEDLHLTAKTTNEFTADVEYLTVRLLLGAAGGEARANEPYEVYGLREVISGNSDAHGFVELEAPAHVQRLFVHFPDQSVTTTVRVGDLDPETEDDGIRTRLYNLGYLPWDEVVGPRLRQHQTPDQRRHDLTEAVRHFQEDEGLPTTGELDDTTRQAIRNRHGA